MLISDIKRLNLHGLTICAAINEKSIRLESHQWATDKNGNVTDIKHRLETETIESACTELIKRAEKIKLVMCE